ncbi:methylmalonyl Co-A mutase-associated GTPase MeaB [Iamia sp. SCSIO 61187]|uniref:methylmalonyl Co-A mutase-associated GTPase MeaB n=1 Tax=Iamia sp. SCSIO 61187 TaxID=2722752 RepID=UPI001C638613|nr:methylmalonyl Co-A mutase-associated GTPase MeaB [Iamia sp. SCSIO 61187]QYG92395.1 methylmalonyl Co-A mutase-associated GTPase MeaB [Iamia sp. SCSIO 61187]
MPAPTDPTALAEGVRAGDRRSLARAITLVESTRADHREQADALVSGLLPHTGGAVRLGISGPPGVGKSTFIEAFGTHLTGLGHRVAVLAVDPSSSRSGGSILGDKTRMERLVRDPHAFIRPSPAGGELGGVARRTREAMLLCEAAGFDVVLVETVGVGQSEIAVADLTDLFVLLASPAGGDDLQGVKRGIMELADVVVVTKADGELAQAAAHACADIRRALHLLRPRHTEVEPQALLASSPTGAGIAEAWDAIRTAHEALAASGGLARQRAQQARAWLWSEVQGALELMLRTDPDVAAALPEVEAQVEAGSLTPSAGARRILGRLRLDR